MSAVMPEHWHPCYEHHAVLEQVLGKEQSRHFYRDLGTKHPCTYCGAQIGKPCVTDANDACAGYQHKSRRLACSDEAKQRIFDLTHDIVEERRANRVATNAVSLPRALPRIRVRSEALAERLDGRPAGVRLGFATLAVGAARKRDEDAWREMAEAQSELHLAEAELRSVAAELGITDVEALLKEPA